MWGQDKPLRCYGWECPLYSKAAIALDGSTRLLWSRSVRLRPACSLRSGRRIRRNRTASIVLKPGTAPFVTFGRNRSSRQECADDREDRQEAREQNAED